MPYLILIVYNLGKSICSLDSLRQPGPLQTFLAGLASGLQHFLLLLHKTSLVDLNPVDGALCKSVTKPYALTRVIFIQLMTSMEVMGFKFQVIPKIL